MAKRITVVVSQGQSAHPAKRKLEEDLVAGLLGVPGVDPTIVPHLYDLQPDGTGMLCLSGITGDMIVCSWLFPRAARWTLDRNQIRGQHGETLIKAYGESDEDDLEDDDLDEDLDDDAAAESEEETPAERVVDRRPAIDRKIYCLDLRTHDSAAPYLEEIERIVRDANTQTVELTDWIEGTPKPEQMERYLKNGSSDGGTTVPVATPSGPIKITSDGAQLTDQLTGQPPAAGEDSARRWYPVIDYGRCTNCLECIDFCLFGVYGVDTAETILVEQPDNCRKGCPACSRVCPENAIIFPQHKTPTIAGSPEVAGTMKIDLSLLFGAPVDLGAPGRADAGDVAARERDEQLVLAGREAVGPSDSATATIPRRQTDRPTEPKDALDNLMDQLDEFDL